MSLSPSQIEALYRKHGIRTTPNSDLTTEKFDTPVLEKSDLSNREIQVLWLVAKGNTNVEIASQLYITRETVKSHMKHITAKMRARNRTHAVALAFTEFNLFPLKESE